MEDLLWDFINRVIRNIIFENLKDLLQEIDNENRSVFTKDLWKMMVEKHGNGNEYHFPLDKFDCTKHEVNSDETIYIFHLPVNKIEEPTFYSALYLKKEKKDYIKRYFKFEKRDNDDNLAQLCEWHHRPSETTSQKDIMQQKHYDQKYRPEVEEFIVAIKSIV